MSKITYTNKVALNENADIPNINKVTDSDMNEIKAVVNNNDDDMITINAKLINATTYSTDETIVGTWIDGKPIYRIVINANMKCNGALTHGIVNLNLITDLKIIFKQTNDNFVILPKNTVEKEYTIGVDKCTSSIIQLSCGSYFANNQNYDFTFIVEYTKTTDV